MKKSKYPLVLIEWEDSVLGFQGWKVIKEQPKKPTKFYSVGFLIRKTKRATTLYPHIEKNDRDKAGAGDIIIPNSAILKVTTLKY